MVTVPSIVHEAVVTAVDSARGVVSVVVVDSGSESCAACAAASLCRHKGAETIQVPSADAASFRPGERVRIAADIMMHRSSVALMLGLPCLMLVLPLVALLVLGFPEWAAFLAGMAGCSVTYLGLYLRRRRLEAAFAFRVISRDTAPSVVGQS